MFFYYFFKEKQLTEKEQGMFNMLQLFNYCSSVKPNDAHVAHPGISILAFEVLLYVYLNEGCRQKEIADALKRKVQAICRNVHSLVNEFELLTQEQDKNDARASNIFLTDKGRNVCNAMLGYIK